MRLTKFNSYNLVLGTLLTISMVILGVSVFGQDKILYTDPELNYQFTSSKECEKESESNDSNKRKEIQVENIKNNSKFFLSEVYNHFKGGVLFKNVENGLDVLWNASFKRGRVYKENLGFFTEQGLLILPNEKNGPNRSSLFALPSQVKDGKLWVSFEGTYLMVLGIIHTHPGCDIETPSPRNDFQYGYLGIHNYVMSRYSLFDAYDPLHFCEFKELGRRREYHKLPASFFVLLP